METIKEIKEEHCNCVECCCGDKECPGKEGLEQN